MKRLPFMDPLVLAIRAGEKTVTRRLVTAPKGWDASEICGITRHGKGAWDVWCSPNPGFRTRSHASGDIVGVAEVLIPLPGMDRQEPDVVGYRCDRREWEHPEDFTRPRPWPWKVRTISARYCPDWAIRTRLRILDVRPERLTAITAEDVTREGVARLGWPATVDGFIAGFRALHELAPDADPWVWRIAFEVSHA